MIYTEAVKITVKRNNGRAVLTLGFLLGELRSVNVHPALQISSENKNQNPSNQSFWSHQSYEHSSLFVCLFIYLLLRWVFVAARGLSLVAANGLLFVAVHGLLIAVASLVAEHGL